MDLKELERLKADFSQNGFLYIPGFLSPDEVDDLESNVNRYIKDVAPRLPKTVAMYVDPANPASLKQIESLEEYDQYFEDLTQRPKLTILAKALMEDDVVSKGLHYFNKPPGLSQATPPHQDGFYFCITPNEAVTIWMALDDMDAENGAVIYVAGSHKKGVLAHNASYVLGFSQGVSSPDAPDLGRPVVCNVKRGDCLVHHSLMIHSAGANESRDRQRRAVSSVYYAKRAQIDPEQQRRYKESVEVQREVLLTSD